MSKLTTKDYKHILQFYKKSIPKSKKTLKNLAENIIATKLCRCIKRFDNKKEAKSIGICTKTVINRKGYKRGNFTCKNKPKIILSKN